MIFEASNDVVSDSDSDFPSLSSISFPHFDFPPLKSRYFLSLSRIFVFHFHFKFSRSFVFLLRSETRSIAENGGYGWWDDRWGSSGSFISRATFSSKFSYCLENERKFHKLINSFYFFLNNHITEQHALCFRSMRLKFESVQMIPDINEIIVFLCRIRKN
jgi:hypothetical protein